jgi:hypothetical protein
MAVGDLKRTVQIDFTEAGRKNVIAEAATS